MTVQNRESKEFARLAREFDEIYHILALRSGLSDSAFMIFGAIIDLGEGCLQKDICRLYFISPQTVNSSIRALVKKGYLQLKPGKKRDMHIYLTPSGRQMIEERLDPFLALENSVFDAIPPEESRELLRLTRKYLDIYRQKLNHFSSED